MKTILKILALVFLTSACSDDDHNRLNKEIKDISLSFSNEIDNVPVVLNAETYLNSSNESYSMSELKYIISNIELIKKNGVVFTYPVEDSYFVINQEEPNSRMLELKNVPIEDYETLRFGIGVDQSNYPLNGVDNFVPTAQDTEMMWSWSAGYIFFKMEGNYQTSNSEGGNFLFHIGSHGTNLDNYKTSELISEFDLDLTNKDLVAVKADISKLFNATHEISIENKPDIQVDPENAPKIAQNVSQMFSLIPINSTN